MNFSKFHTHNQSNERAFESLCNHLFEHWLIRTYQENHKKLIVVNGSGGDGGVEAYSELKNGTIIGIQSKWFDKSLTAKQIGQIRKSIITAKGVRIELRKIIICAPRDLTNKKRINKAKNLLSIDTDFKKVESLKKELSEVHNDLEVEYWGEHEILKELMIPSNQGIYSFWFENSIINFQYLKHRFEVAKSGWLSLRYIPDIHIEGFIQRRTQAHLRSLKYKEYVTFKLKELEASLRFIRENLNRICKAIDADDVLSTFQTQINSYISGVNSLIIAVDTDERDFHFDSEKVELGKVKKALHEAELPAVLKQEYEQLTNELLHMDFQSINKELKLLALECRNQYILFFGKPGMGKTHALANLVENSLELGIPAIVLQARNSPTKSWSEILKYLLDGFNNWNTIEIVNALEAVAYSAEAHLVSLGKISGISSIKSIVAIDGLDESTERDDWIERINELEAYVKSSTRVQFILTARDSFAQEEIIWNDYNRIYSLPTHGDVSIEELYPLYAEKYNAPTHPWIGLALTDLLSLRLFCELYQNKKDVSEDSISTTFSTLIKKKIELIEDEFYRSFDISKNNKEDQLFLRILNQLGKVFFEKTEISRDELSKEITSSSLDLIKHSQSRDLIRLFCNHGILTEFRLKNQEAYATDQYRYQVINESILEFIIANELVIETVQSGSKELPRHIMQLKRVIQIAAEILASDFSILPGQDGLWTEQLSKSFIETLKLRSIGTLSTEKQKAYIELGKESFVESMDQRNKVLEHWIMPNIRKPNSEYNALFVHEILASMNSVFERDLIWSGPDHYGERGINRISYYLRNIALSKDDAYNGLPLLMTWSLTTVDNIYREKIRIRLTDWGSQNLIGFLKILELVYLKYDPQMDEDLSQIGMGIASVQTKPDTRFAQLSIWMLKNIFSKENILSNRNVVVRLAGRSIAEKAFSLGLISKELLNLSTPPYDVSFRKLKLDTEGETQNRGERYPIVHDLAWYVLDNSFRGFLDYSIGNDLDEDSSKFLGRYDDFDGGPYEFAMAAAIAYIKSLGWNRTDGPGMTQATHGGKSEIATFEEKYTWLAVHYLRGYFADYLPFEDDIGNKEKVTDYNKIISVQNPGNHISGLFYPELNEQWFIPTEISPKIEISDDTIQEDIKKWVLTDRPLDFKKWHYVSGKDLSSINKELEKDEWLVINNDTTLAEPKGVCQTAIHTNAFFIKSEEFEDFLSGLNELKEEDVRLFARLDSIDMHSSPLASSPCDAVFMDCWVEERFEESEFNDIKILKSTAEITGQVEGHDKYYELPSKTLREWLNIKSTDSKVFLNSDKEIVAFVNEIGQSYYDKQKLLVVDKEALLERIAENGYMILWSVFIFQTTTLKTMERQDHMDIHHQNCRLSIVWNEGETFKEHVYQKEGWSRH